VAIDADFKNSRRDRNEVARIDVAPIEVNTSEVARRQVWAKFLRILQLISPVPSVLSPIVA
jgi:hypothetical protein